MDDNDDYENPFLRFQGSLGRRDTTLQGPSVTITRTDRDDCCHHYLKGEPSCFFCARISPEREAVS